MKIGDTTISAKHIKYFTDYGYPEKRVPGVRRTTKTVGFFKKRDISVRVCAECGRELDAEEERCDELDCVYPGGARYKSVLRIMFVGDDEDELEFDDIDLSKTEHEEAIKKLEALNL